jgi:hypothetical protein
MEPGLCRESVVKESADALSAAPTMVIAAMMATIDFSCSWSAAEFAAHAPAPAETSNLKAEDRE